MASLRDLSALHSPYQLDIAFYAKLFEAKPQYKLVDKIVIQPFSGRGFLVSKGQVFRVVEDKGPQIGDVVLYNAHDSRESFHTLRTWEMEGWFLKRFSRLWSDSPWLRPMATCMDDTLDFNRGDDEFHHHLAATHCAPEQLEMITGQSGLNACRANLLQALEPFGLKEEDIDDNVDVFQKWALDRNTGRFYGARTDAKAGDYIEFYAEIDLLVGVSVCPTGDGTRAWSIPDRDVVLPLRVEVYDTGIEPQEFPSSTI